MVFIFYFKVLLIPILMLTAIYSLSGTQRVRSLLGLFFLLTIVLILFIFRDIYAPQDIWSYFQIYNGMSGFDSVVNAYQNDYTFAILLHLGRILGLSAEGFYYSLSVFYVLTLLLGYKYLFPNLRYVVFCFILFICTSTFILMFTNALRQGLAVILLILTISLYLRSFKISSYISLILATFSHLTMFPFALFFIIRTTFYREKFPTRLIILFLPFTPLLGYLLLNELAPNFNKIQASIVYNEVAYGKNSTYVKIFILYVFGIIFHWYGKECQMFESHEYKFIFDAYIFGLLIVFMTMPILYIASRWLYYPSALMPILLTYIFFSRKNLLSVKSRIPLYFITIFLYGYFVYNFPSIVTQLIAVES